VNYAPTARLEDRLGPHEPPYRSRGEAQVGRLLDRSRIPFFYEQPTLIYDRGRHRIWRPDFTLPTYNGLIIEYAGMMDIPSYAAGIHHKVATYARNGVPALIVYPTDLRERDWRDRTIERISHAGSSPDGPRYEGLPARPVEPRSNIGRMASAIILRRS